MRLLDVGCGWGGMVMHAAAHHGVRAVGVTVSQRQAELAEKRVAEAGLATGSRSGCRTTATSHDGPFDAISSIGMFEHVGAGAARDVLRPAATSCSRPAGRLLNHGISRPARRTPMRPDARPRSRAARSSTATCSPTASCTRSARCVSAMQRRGLRGAPRGEPARALRADAAGVGRATSRPTGTRAWSSSTGRAGPGCGASTWPRARSVRANGNQIHQVLAVKPDGGNAGIPLRPSFDAA